MRAMHAAMSPDNMYLRFFSMSPAAAEQEARRVCREPDSEHAALLAWQDGQLAGVGAYESTEQPGVAEVAFAVPDDMHGRGIASLLLEHLVWLARQRGLEATPVEHRGGELGHAAGIRGRRGCRRSVGSAGAR